MGGLVYLRTFAATVSRVRLQSSKSCSPERLPPSDPRTNYLLIFELLARGSNSSGDSSGHSLSSKLSAFLPARLASVTVPK